jgi:GPH family glycoside/pentoside/hexuronide:cation symporter
MQSPDTRLPVFLKASWGVGALGTTSMLYMINLFLVYFLVRHAGIPAAVAGTLLAITRFYDAVIDPGIGMLSDRTESRWGRRRPWLLAGAVLSPLAVIAVFNPPASLSGQYLYAYVLVAMLFYCTAYSLFSIPFVALGTEMSDNYGERASVMAYRTFFVYSSGVVVASGAPALVALLGSDRAAYSQMSFAVAGVVGAAMLWVVFFTGRARITPRSTQTMDIGQWIRTVLSNTPYMIILFSKMALYLGTAFSGAVSLFFMTYVLQKGEGAFAIYGLVSNLVSIATVPLWGRLLRTVERRPAFIVLLVGNALGHLSWLLASPEEPMALFVARAIYVGSLGGGSVLISLAMLSDAIEYDRLRTGLRRAGAFVGGFELMQTTSFVVGPLVVGFALSAAGLVPGQVDLGVQPESALVMIKIAYAIIPAVCGLVGIVLTFFYRLDARRLAEMRDAGSSAPPDRADGPGLPAATT